MSIFGTPSKGSGGQLSSSSTATASAVNTGAGDLIVVAVGWARNGSANVSSITDTVGNSFTAGTLVTGITGAHRMFYCLSSAGANASNVVQVTFGAAQSYAYVYVWSVPISGGSAAFDLEATAASSSSNNHPTTGTFSTTGTDEIVFAGAINDFSGITYTAGTGYSIDGSSIVSGLAGTEHVTFSSTQSGIVADLHQGSSTDWLVSAMAFKKAVAGASAKAVVCIMQ